MNRITFSSVIEKDTNISPRDIMNLVKSLVNDSRFNGTEIYVNSYDIKDDEHYPLMTTLTITFQSWTGRDDVSNDGKGTKWRFVCHRAKDFSCHNISINKIN